MAQKRKSMTQRQSKKVFRAGTKVNLKNAKAMPMRGGIRL